MTAPTSYPSGFHIPHDRDSGFTRDAVLTEAAALPVKLFGTHPLVKSRFQTEKGVLLRLEISTPLMKTTTRVLSGYAKLGPTDGEDSRWTRAPSDRIALNGKESLYPVTLDP